MIIVGLAREFSASAWHVTWHPGLSRSGTARRPDQLRRHLGAGPRVRQRRVSLTGIEAVSTRSARCAARGLQRPADPGDPGLHRDVPDRRHLLDRPHHPRGPVPQRCPDGGLPGGRPGFGSSAAGRSCSTWCRRRHHDLVHRRQHQLQRLPVPDQLRRRGLVPAPSAGKRGHRLVFSNGIIVLDHPGPRPAVRRRREHRQAGPALRDRRVHRLLHGRLRHGPLPPASREPGWRRRMPSTSPAASTPRWS